MAWFQKNPDIFQCDMGYIRRTFPDVSVYIKHWTVRLDGPFPVLNDKGITIGSYKLKVVFPADYPDWIPDVYMLEPNVPPCAERHIDCDGKACLCLPHEVPRLVGHSVTFEAFHKRLLNYWLVGQLAYERTGEWPYKAWEHGIEGVIEGFTEITGFNNREAVTRFLQLLVRKNPAKGHEWCPCGSGLRLRNCHFDLYRQCRQCLPFRAYKVYRRYLSGLQDKQ